jgi:hypothetical protein
MMVPFDYAQDKPFGELRVNYQLTTSTRDKGSGRAVGNHRNKGKRYYG